MKQDERETVEAREQHDRACTSDMIVAVRVILLLRAVHIARIGNQRWAYCTATGQKSPYGYRPRNLNTFVFGEHTTDLVQLVGLAIPVYYYWLAWFTYVTYVSL